MAMLAGLRGIDEDIWKAARVDGIPTWKTYVFIVIPMMRGVFVTTFVIVMRGIVELYDLVVAKTGGGPGIASKMPAKYVIQYMFGQNLGQGFAASTMMLLTVADRDGGPLGLSSGRNREGKKRMTVGEHRRFGAIAGKASATSFGRAARAHDRSTFRRRNIILYAMLIVVGASTI